MREFIDSHKIANTVRMLRTRGYAGALVLVEGDDDARWLRKFLRAEETRPLPASGKDRVLAALRSLRDTAAADGVLAVVDADFDHLLRVPADADVLRTDCHDVECMLLGSSALRQVLAEYASPDKLDQLRESGRTVLEVLLSAGRPVGVFRLAARPGHDGSEALFAGLSLQDLPFADFLEPRSLSVQLRPLIRAVKNRSQRQDIDEVAALSCLQEHLRRHEAADAWQICRGHDLVAILLQGLCSLFGSQRPSQLTQDRLEASLRLAYTEESFKQTGLYGALLAWQEAHPDYRLL
jgi:hypothetical protein